MRDDLAGAVINGDERSRHAPAERNGVLAHELSQAGLHRPVQRQVVNEARLVLLGHPVGQMRGQ